MHWVLWYNSTLRLQLVRWLLSSSTSLPPPPSPIGGGWPIDDSFSSIPGRRDIYMYYYQKERQLDLQIHNFGAPDIPATPGSSLRGRRAQCVADE